MFNLRYAMCDVMLSATPAQPAQAGKELAFNAFPGWPLHPGMISI